MAEQIIEAQWDRYRRADREGKLDLLRHRFSVLILYADDGYEDLRVVLDDRAELKYAVNKAPVRKSISVCGMQTGK